MHRSRATRIVFATIIVAGDTKALRECSARNFFTASGALAARGVDRIAPPRFSVRLRANPHEFETFCNAMRRGDDRCAQRMMLRRAAVAMEIRRVKTACRRSSAEGFFAVSGVALTRRPKC
jgi:hypothetical protein